jgi:hypothetical protein
MTSGPCALEALAEALPRQQFSTSLTAGHDQPSRLAVVHRSNPSDSAEIYVEDGWYLWAWGERLGPVGLAAAVAATLAAAMTPRVRS